MNTVKKILSSLAFLTCYSFAIVCAYKILSLLFNMSGIIMFVATGLTAILILLTTFGIIMAITGHSKRYEIHRMHETVTNALNEIANGNFNVFIEPDPHSPHNEIAEAMNKMAQSLGTLETMRQDFISNVSHEIQSPLTSIGGFAQLLQNEKISDEERLKYAGIIHAESKRLSSLSDNLLKLSSLEKAMIDKKEYRLDKQIKDVILTLEPQWTAKNILLEADLDRVNINADMGLLAQAWVNLLHNAIKFTPNGGAIYVCLENGDGVNVAIVDNGLGIGTDDLPHVFERFYKADKARDRALGGNGLGLSLVKKIVELCDGRVTVESELGKGTTVKVYFKV